MGVGKSNNGKSDEDRVTISDMNFERQFLRSVLLYGCYNMKDYTDKAGIFHFVNSSNGRNASRATIGDRENRLNFFLPYGYLSHEKGGSYSCSYDFSNGKNDALLFEYSLGKCNVSFSREFILILSCLEKNGPMRKGTIGEELQYVKGIDKTVSKNTVAGYLDNFTNNGFLKLNNKMYSITDDVLQDFNDEELIDLIQCLDFAASSFSFHVPFYFAMRRIRLYLMDRHHMDWEWIIKQRFRNEHIVARKAHTFNQLDDDQIYKLLIAIHEHRKVSIELYDKKRFHESDSKIELNKKILPVKIMNDVWTGRMMLVCLDLEQNKAHQYRIDYINQITILDKVTDDVWSKAVQATDIMQYAWSTYENEPASLEQVTIRFHIPEENNYMLERLNREKRSGRLVSHIDQDYIYSFEVTDANDMIPWIRSYGEFAEVISPEELRIKVSGQWKRMEKQLEGKDEFTCLTEEKDLIGNAIRGKVNSRKRKIEDLTVFPSYENIRNEILIAFWNMAYENGWKLSNDNVYKISSYLLPDDSEIYDHLSFDELMGKNVTDEDDASGKLFVKEKNEKCWKLNFDLDDIADHDPVRLSNLEKEAVVNLISMPQCHYFMDEELIEKIRHAFSNISPSWNIQDITLKNQWRKELWNEDYTDNFREIRHAMDHGHSISFRYNALHSDLYNGEASEHGYPLRAEYSPGEERMRLIVYTENHTFAYMVVGQMSDVSEDINSDTKDLEELYKEFLKGQERTMIMKIKPVSYAVERIVRLFSYYEKTITYNPADSVYTMRLKYNVFDEKALIRDVLSCGDYVIVEGNPDLKAAIQKRVQKTVQNYNNDKEKK